MFPKENVMAMAIFLPISAIVTLLASIEMFYECMDHIKLKQQKTSLGYSPQSKRERKEPMVVKTIRFCMFIASITSTIQCIEILYVKNPNNFLTSQLSAAQICLALWSNLIVISLKYGAYNMIHTFFDMKTQDLPKWVAILIGTSTLISIIYVWILVIFCLITENAIYQR